jgi:hypothetical protein
VRDRSYLVASVVFVVVAVAVFATVVVMASTGRTLPLPAARATAATSGSLRPFAAELGCDVASADYINQALGVQATSCEVFPVALAIMCSYSGDDLDGSESLQATVSYLPNMTHEKFVEIRTSIQQPMGIPSGFTVPPGLPTSSMATVTDYPGLGDEAYVVTALAGGVPLAPSNWLIAWQGSLEIQVISAASLDAEAGLIRDLFAVLPH